MRIFGDTGLKAERVYGKEGDIKGQLIGYVAELPDGSAICFSLTNEVFNMIERPRKSGELV